MWASQFGFRPNRNTSQALHCARRALELACSSRNGALHLVALDWRKAFDSINPDRLLLALRRFGLPQNFLDIVSSIYDARKFNVRDCGLMSRTGQLQSGVCQGCPLSPFLFGIVMTVLMSDACTGGLSKPSGIRYTVRRRYPLAWYRRAQRRGACHCN